MGCEAVAVGWASVIFFRVREGTEVAGLSVLFKWVSRARTPSANRNSPFWITVDALLARVRCLRQMCGMQPGRWRRDRERSSRGPKGARRGCAGTVECECLRLMRVVRVPMLLVSHRNHRWQTLCRLVVDGWALVWMSASRCKRRC